MKTVIQINQVKLMECECGWGQSETERNLGNVSWVQKITVVKVGGTIPLAVLKKQQVLWG